MGLDAYCWKLLSAVSLLSKVLHLTGCCYGHDYELIRNQNTAALGTVTPHTHGSSLESRLLTGQLNPVLVACMTTRHQSSLPLPRGIDIIMSLSLYLYPLPTQVCRASAWEACMPAWWLASSQGQWPASHSWPLAQRLWPSARAPFGMPLPGSPSHLLRMKASM